MRDSAAPTSVHRPTDVASRRTAPLTGIRHTSIGRLEIVRQNFRRRGFSRPLVELLVAGSRASTLSTYESAWRTWATWCYQRGEDPLSTTLAFVLEFLANLHGAGKSYSTINVHRSMLSKTLPHFEGHPVGSHPLVKGLLSGCFNINPPKPRYNSSWDPNVVVSYMASLGENSSLPLSKLSHKTAVLLALASLLRVSELASINFQSVTFSSSGVNFTLLKPRKAQHSGPLQSIFIPSLREPGCCPVETIKAYVDATAPHRNHSNINSLFVSCNKPHRNITSNTVSGWIRSSLAAAGIDTSVFSAHSTRGASASKALAAGISIDAILKTGNWARESTFNKFYKRNSIPSLASAVLDPTPQT